MHDIRAIRENPAAFDAALAKRGLSPMSADILALDGARRAKITASETAQRALTADKKAEIAALDAEAKAEDDKLRDLLLTIPNLPQDDVPEGADEADNVEMHRRGTPPEFGFAPKEHYELPAVQDGMDFETAAKLSGSRFVLMSGGVARIHRALAQFMLDTHTSENGLTEVNTPVLVRDEAMLGTGQLPKFAEDSYQTTNGWWLIPTSEVTLTNIVSGTMIDEGYLPRRYTAHSLCFRSEAGSAGRDTSGMLRQHQFEKVEMVSITRPEDSRAELDRMTKCAEGILEKLGLAYRTMVLCTGDMGFGAQRTHDIEVWLPGQNTYREISSVSVCGDFQARRMNARFKRDGAKKPEFVHTLNGSGLAVGRCLIAVLENGQQADGSVKMPSALVPYLGGKTILTAAGLLV
jgi:seryl-tRNA synthetase